MSAEKPESISTTVEHDGAVMMNASDVVAWLRHCAEQYGSGARGSTPYRCAAAREALDKVADGIQSAYIDVCADEATYWFGGSA